MPAKVYLLSGRGLDLSVSPNAGVAELRWRAEEDRGL